MSNIIKNITLALLAFILVSTCTVSPPVDVADVCDIFDDRHSWYRAAKRSEQLWGVPIAVNMAIMYQESAFEARAKPPRKRILGFIPGSRTSSALGYAQALDTTWQDYVEASGNVNASRTDFIDAIDFVAWYNARSNRANNIAKVDARNLYFAYHEGNRGYQRGRHHEKQWLLEAADRVQANSSRFSTQIASCQSDLDKNWWQRLIS
jgi:hypothetical protein